MGNDGSSTSSGASTKRTSSSSWSERPTTVGYDVGLVVVVNIVGRLDGADVVVVNVVGTRVVGIVVVGVDVGTYVGTIVVGLPVGYAVGEGVIGHGVIGLVSI